MFSDANEPSSVADKRNSTQIDVGDIGSDAMYRCVGHPIDFVTIILLVSRRRLVDHQHGISFKIDGLPQSVTQLSCKMYKTSIRNLYSCISSTEMLLYLCLSQILHTCWILLMSKCLHGPYCEE